MGGCLHVASAGLGQGATFTLELPSRIQRTKHMNTHISTSESDNHRILIIDDNPAIHEDFRKILGPADAKLAEELDATEASLFGDKADAARALDFQIDSAFQGQEGLEKVRAACAEGSALRGRLCRRADAAGLGWN